MDPDNHETQKVPHAAAPEQPAKASASADACQTVSQSGLSDSFPLRMTFLFRDEACTIIHVNVAKEQIRIQNLTDDIFHRAFGTVLEPTWEDFEQFLADRCFSPSVGFLEDNLRALGIDAYDPLQIVEKTQGRTEDDEMWIRFEYGDGSV